MLILPFDPPNLATAFSNDHTSVNIVQGKEQFVYLEGYLGEKGLNAKTIIIEEGYVSKDFLDDYASYYAYCFETYGKLCRRVHFFSVEITNDLIDEHLLTQDVDSDFWNNYLGFVVIKPIPTTIIGFTILKTYPSSENYNERNFWGIRDYAVHVFGREIRLRSLAFQEQDSVLAACATTAIWAMLNKAALDYHTVLKSPSMITKDADHISFDGSRLFPNSGLNILQICEAIFKSGLDTEVMVADLEFVDEEEKNEEGDEDSDQIDYPKQAISSLYAKKIIHAYSPLGIPLILVILVPSGEEYGLHAITVSGSKTLEPQDLEPQDEMNWIASNMEQFYAHDDQWGPFVRIPFLDEHSIQTPWSCLDSSPRPTFISNIIVPVFPKVRISYQDIEVITDGLDRILKYCFENELHHAIVWSIQIRFSENYKSMLRDSNLPKNVKIKKLKESLPKYLWISSAYIGKYRILDFTFDATGVSNAMICKDVISYSSEISQRLQPFLKSNVTTISDFIHHSAAIDYIEFVASKLDGFVAGDSEL